MGMGWDRLQPFEELDPLVDVALSLVLLKYAYHQGFTVLDVLQKLRILSLGPYYVLVTNRFLHQLHIQTAVDEPIGRALVILSRNPLNPLDLLIKCLLELRKGQQHCFRGVVPFGRIAHLVQALLCKLLKCNIRRVDDSLSHLFQPFVVLPLFYGLQYLRVALILLGCYYVLGHLQHTLLLVHFIESFDELFDRALSAMGQIRLQILDCSVLGLVQIGGDLQDNPESLSCSPVRKFVLDLVRYRVSRNRLYGLSNQFELLFLVLSLHGGGYWYIVYNGWAGTFHSHKSLGTH